MDAVAQRTPDGSTPEVLYSRFPLTSLGDGKAFDAAPLAKQHAEARGANYTDAATRQVAPHVDVEYYRAVYPDIGRVNLDPVLHYHGPGWREGRNPNSWFDTRYYLAANPDIQAAGIDPLLHYVAHGRAEGRHPRRPGGERRAVADRATPPVDRPAGYDAPRLADRLSAAGLLALVQAACAGARGLAVSVSHDRYIDITGGIQLLINDEQTLFNGDRFTYLHVSPAVARMTLDLSGDEAALLQVVLDGRFMGLVDMPAAVEALAQLPAECAAIRLFVVHSVFGHQPATLVALARAARASDCFFWLHDYGSVCEGYNLLRDDVAFCDAPPAASMQCRVCVYGTQRQTYRAALQEVFAALPFHVLAPSQAALSLWLRAAELPYRSASVHANCVLTPRHTATAKAPGGRVRVAFAGFPLSHKGWPLFRELVLRTRDLGIYEFFHFSSPETLQHMDGLTGVPAQVERYDRFAMVRALEERAIDLVAMLSPWPETFSYVTYEAFAAGADVVALADSGNVADAVRRYRRGVVLRDTRALLRFFGDLHAVHYAACRRQAATPPMGLFMGGSTATVDLQRSDGPDTEALLTDDPDLRVIAGEAEILPRRDGDDYCFELPEQAGEIRLVSRKVSPGMLRMGVAEPRRLGVAVSRLLLDGAIVPPGDARRRQGWHGAESAWEWTGGDATLDAGSARVLEVRLERLLRYMRSPLAGAA